MYRSFPPLNSWNLYFSFHIPPFSSTYLILVLISSYNFSISRSVSFHYLRSPLFPSMGTCPPLLLLIFLHFLILLILSALLCFLLCLFYPSFTSFLSYFYSPLTPPTLFRTPFTISSSHNAICFVPTAFYIASSELVPAISGTWTRLRSHGFVARGASILRKVSI